MKPGAPRVAYDVHHSQPWGWKVSTYLWTKSIAAGSLGLAAALALFDWSTDLGLLEVAAPILALFFISVTAALLIADLKRPERFWYLLLKPNRTSWLALGGYVLAAFGALATAWLAAGVLDVDAEATWIGLGILGVPLAAAGSGYTAYLFGQAEGRDFWQSPLLLPHLLIQATVAGASMLLLVGVGLDITTNLAEVLSWILLGGLLANALVIFAELFSAHPTTHIARAASSMTVGSYSRLFWYGAILIGHLIPLVLATIYLSGGPDGAFEAAALLALAGLLAYEHAWIKAGQVVPLS